MEALSVSFSLSGHHFGTIDAWRGLLVQRCFIYHIDGYVVQRGIDDRHVTVESRRAKVLPSTMLARCSRESMIGMAVESCRAKVLPSAMLAWCSRESMIGMAR
jgi:hypothetical protein